MKSFLLWVFALCVCVTPFAPAQDRQSELREGNFDIRFEPTAKLQTGAPVPFQITVKNALRKPLEHARVKLQIEDKGANSVQAFRATETDPGTYIAKPVFPSAGEWSVYVEVVREGAKTARTIQFQISD